jgi:hypothetical protein
MEAGFFVNIYFLTWNWNLGKFGHSSLVRPGLDFFIGIDLVINRFRLERRYSKKNLRFRYPVCHGFHTATNPKTNLARCFESGSISTPLIWLWRPPRAALWKRLSF